jgi:hypothetical protein
VQGTGTDDGISRGAPPAAALTLIALATAGRDPADITIPTTGSKAASGGEGSSGSGSSSSSGGTGSSGSGSGRSSGTSRTRDGGSGSEDALVARAGGASPSGVMVSQGMVTVSASANGTASTSAAASAGGNGSPSGSDDSGKSEVTPDDAPAGGGAAKGSPLAPVSSFLYSFFVEQPKQAVQKVGTALQETGEGLYAIATSPEARQAAVETLANEPAQIKQAIGNYQANLGDTMLRQAELRGGIEQSSDLDLFRYGLETLIGGRAVNAAVGVDEKGNVVDENLSGLGPRAQALFFGIADFFNAWATGLGAVSSVTGLEFKLGSTLTQAEAELLAAMPKDGESVGAMRTLLEEAEEAPAATKSAGLSCFPAGTLVATADGLKPIETIAEGDLVRSYDLVTSEWQLRRVQRAYCRPCEGYAASVTVAGETIVSTSRHPYFVTRGDDLDSRPRLEHLAEAPAGATTPGRWVDAADLRAGDGLLLLNGQVAQVDEIRLYPFFDTVYNFEVDDLHCYAVGRAGILVHNNNGKEVAAPNTPVTRGTGSTPETSAPNSIYEQTTPDGQLVRRGNYDQEGNLFSREDYMQTSPHKVEIDGTRYNLRNQPHEHALRTLTAPDGTTYQKWQVRILDQNGNPITGWVNSGPN